MKRSLLGFVGVLLMALTSCGGIKSFDVSGTVTYDGKPLPEGYIAFIPEEGGRGGGGTISNGQYKVTAQAGKNRVEITASKMTKLPEGQVGMDGATEEMRQYIPEKYNAKSDLKADITSSGKPLDFDLKPVE